MVKFPRAPQAAVLAVTLLTTFAAAPAIAQNASTSGEATESVDITLLRAGMPAAATPAPRTSGRAQQLLPDTEIVDYTFVFPSLTNDPALLAPTTGTVDVR